jgi:Uma2 family endonuclease
MPTATLKKSSHALGPGDNGILMTPREFDRADFADGWRYELINRVLVVSPIQSDGEVDPNDELGYLLRRYREDHPHGSTLDATMFERTVHIGNNRRRADRVIWAGLGRRPRKNEAPTIIAEFVSKRKRDRDRDYETKRDEYRKIRVKKYWIIDRFKRTMTVYSWKAGKTTKRIVQESQVYKTDLLPGFELPLKRLLAAADYWPDERDEDE